MANRLGEHAVVIGGSIAGLMTARVLTEHFDSVTVLERDHINDSPALHRSIPQGHHIHVLFLGGQQVLSSLYPGFTDGLYQLGAVRNRAGRDVAFILSDGKAYSVTGTVREPRDLGFDGYNQSRGLLEYHVRQCTQALPTVRFTSDSLVEELLYDHGRVQGVRYTRNGESQTCVADLVVDTGGRGAHAPRWLKALGFPTPAETTIGVDLAYASTKFRVPAYYDEPERVLLFYGRAPQYVKTALLAEIEDHTWIVSLAGRFGEYPPGDAEGFLAFAQSLYTPKLYQLLKDAERVADITTHRFPTSVLRHYERLRAFPEGLLVLGDALSSFNPVYGQGMSSAALQVKALQQVLQERVAGGQELEGLALAFFPKAAETIRTPWTLAANQDFAFPQTQGERPTDLMARRQYFAAVDALTVEDVEVHRLMAEVFALAKPLSALSEEPLRSRALARLQKQGSA